MYRYIHSIYNCISLPLQYLDDFNMSSSKEMKLVFFLDAVEHVSRLGMFVARIHHLNLSWGLPICAPHYISILYKSLTSCIYSFNSELPEWYVNLEEMLC